MPRTAAKFTQADMARAVRAIAQARVKGVVEVGKDGTLRVVIDPDASALRPVERTKDIVL